MKEETKKRKKDIKFLEDTLKVKGQCMEIPFKNFIEDRCPNCPIVKECTLLSENDPKAFLKAIEKKIMELKNGK